MIGLFFLQLQLAMQPIHKAIDPLIDGPSAKALAVIYATRVKKVYSDVPLTVSSDSKNWNTSLKDGVWFCRYFVPELDKKDAFYQFICLGIGSRDGKYLGLTLTDANLDKWKKSISSSYNKK